MLLMMMMKVMMAGVDGGYNDVDGGAVL